MDEKEVNNFDKITRMKQTFKILQANNQAHIVTDHITKTTGYALFSANEPVQHGLLSSTSAPALIMVQQLKEQEATLSVVQPDLNFPQLKPIQGYSQPLSLTITIKGVWQVTNKSKDIRVKYLNGDSEITLKCQHGLSVQIGLYQ
jgi:chondroitin-sulfate-ABC endolyase/exolyase